MTESMDTQSPQQPEDAPAQTPPQKSINWWKRATLLLLLLVTVGGYLMISKKNPPPIISPPFSSTPSVSQNAPTDPMANWKTYTNDQFGFSFRYPPEDTIYVGESDPQTFSIQVRSPVGYNGWAHNIEFSNKKLTPKQSLRDYIQKRYNIVGNYIEPTNQPYDLFSYARFQITQFTDVQLPNTEAIRFLALIESNEPDRAPASGLSLNEAYIKNPSKDEIVVMRNTNGTNSESTPLFDQILSTFQFTL